MVEGKMALIKYLMFFFNFLFWLSGLALIIVGAVIRHQYGDYLTFADGKFSSAAVFIIIVGVIVFIIGFLGCFGAIKSNYCMVTTFAVLLSLIFILEIIAGALGFAYRHKVKDAADKAVERAVRHIYKEKGARDFINWVQKRLQCCGTNGSSSYDSVVPPANATSPIPKSCCNKTFSTCDASNAYKIGCTQKFEDFVRRNLIVIGAVAIGIAFIQLLGISFACCLMKAIKGEYEVV